MWQPVWPQRLKPAFQVRLYRSAKALRHPKAVLLYRSAKALRHPKAGRCLSQGRCATQKQSFFITPLKRCATQKQSFFITPLKRQKEVLRSRPSPSLPPPPQRAKVGLAGDPGSRFLRMTRSSWLATRSSRLESSKPEARSSWLEARHYLGKFRGHALSVSMGMVEKCRAELHRSRAVAQ